jgi:DNA-binding transcriptional LysR family regulator
MLEFRHLRYFVAVAEELNFSRAAQRLHMAQPPLSVAIRQLEQEIGAQLFERSSREVKLTVAGEVLLEGARRTLESLEGTVAAARRAAEGALGTLRIAFSWSARVETLPAIGRAFSSRYPEVTLVTEEMWNVRVAGALRSADIDLAICLCPDLDGELQYETVRLERIAALVPDGHPLAGTSEAPLADFAQDTFVLFPRELAPRLYDTMIALCRGAGFEPKLSRSAFHSAGNVGTLAGLESVALVPASAASGIAGVTGVLLSDADARFETAFVWHERTASAAAANFRSVARGLFG